MRNPHAGLPFTAADMNDAAIATALEDVSVPTLLLSCLHITGDASLLDGPLRPQGLFLNEVQASCPTRTKPRPARWPST